MMSKTLPQIYLVRHGETEWSLGGQHTGRTDIPLTEKGEQDARRVAERLRGLTFDAVYTSPLIRARRTCELAGFGENAQSDPDLQEWDYGAYEGRRTVEIRENRPDWSLFRDGVPDGEALADVAARADNVVARLRTVPGNALVFSHGHFLRVLAARWLGLSSGSAGLFMLSTASLSILGYDHNLDEPAVRLWNDDSHLQD